MDEESTGRRQQVTQPTCQRSWQVRSWQRHNWLAGARRLNSGTQVHALAAEAHTLEAGSSPGAKCHSDAYPPPPAAVQWSLLLLLPRQQRIAAHRELYRCAPTAACCWEAVAAAAAAAASTARLQGAVYYRCAPTAACCCCAFEAAGAFAASAARCLAAASSASFFLRATHLLCWYTWKKVPTCSNCAQGHGWYNAKAYNANAKVGRSW